MVDMLNELGTVVRKQRTVLSQTFRGLLPFSCLWTDLCLEESCHTNDALLKWPLGVWGRETLVWRKLETALFELSRRSLGLLGLAVSGVFRFKLPLGW